MSDLGYHADVKGIAAGLERDHGRLARDVAFENVRQHMREGAWKHCAMWLRVANRLAPENLAREVNH